MGTLAAVGAMVGAAQAVAATSWSPLALFAASEQGVWYDPSDFATMFQDDAGTIPITTTGQSVGKILDKSGNNNHAIQATAGNRPTLEQDAFGAYYLSFSATKHLATSAFAWNSEKVSLFSAHGQTATTGNYKYPVSFGDPLANDVGSWAQFYFSDQIGHGRCGSSTFGFVHGNETLVSTGTSITTTTNVTSTHLDLSGTTHATEQPMQRRQGVTYAHSGTFGLANSGTGNFGTKVLRLGRGGTSANYFAGRLYQLVARSALSTADEITEAETFVGNNSGTGAFAITETLAPFQVSDSRPLVDRTTHYEASPFAHIDFTTTAMRLEVDSYDTINSSDSEVNVEVDGAFYKLIAASTGVKTTNFVLPQGTKTVSVINGLQAKSGATVVGAWMTEIRASAPMTQINLTPANRLLIYGDSIACGDGATSSVKEGWPILVRDASGNNSVAVEAWGFRTLYQDAANGTLRAAFVSLVASYAPAKIWLAIGRNDYGIAPWSAAAFGSAYAALLDDLHTALPSAVIYAQTPIVQTTETANGQGSTLGDYRAQIATAQSTRSSYTTLVDGTTFMTTGDLIDGVHPSTAGHALYGAAVIAALGL